VFSQQRQPDSLFANVEKHTFMYRASMPSTSVCPICQGSAKQSRSVGDLIVASCSNCGHGWLTDVQPDNKFYETSHYVNWRHENQAGEIRRRAEQYLTDFYDLVAGGPRTAVEIGCSTGETIGLLAERGVQGWGADTSEAAIAQARARFPQVGFTVGTMPIPDVPVDAALMMHVIEHVPSPIDVLHDVRSLVAGGGTIYLRTPNYAGAAAQVLRGAWPDFYAEHLHYFTHRSITTALSAAGWHLENVRTEGGAWAWLGGVKRVVKQQRPSLTKGTGAPPGRRQMQVLSLAERWGQPLWKAEGRSGRGNELVVTARRATG
jgi:SAM-dependent methyltransferase